MSREMIGGPGRGGASDQKKLDAESRALLYQGASYSQLAIMFNQDIRTISKKMQGVEPIGTRGGHAVYLIRDAAQYLVKPLGNIEEFIAKMDPEDLPPRLNKRYWDAIAARNKVLEDQGELWNTAEVLAHFSTTFQVLKLNLELMQDAVEEQTSFTPRQREILTELIDGALSAARATLTEQFAESGEPAVPAEVPVQRDAQVEDGDVHAGEEDDDEAFFTVHHQEADEEAL